jgi:imidazolonepropionase-like amidohydrolase
LVAFAVVTAGAAQQREGAPVDVAVRAARLIDPSSGQARGPVVVLVTGERVSRIIPANRFDSKSARSMIDLKEATLIPGLTDAHVHLQIGGQPEANAMAALQSGFTTLVDLGATSDVVLRLRDRIAAGTTQGPRILAAGLWAGTKNGICEFGGIGVAGGADGFRARVRDNVAAGADLIKVCVSGWPAAAFEKPNTYEIADDALAAVVDESTRANRIVVAHAISLGAAKAAAHAGVRGLAHAAYVDTTTAVALSSGNVFMIPTLTTLTRSPGPASDALKAAVATAHRAGVRIVFGTDAGVLPHGKNAVEFRALVDAGLAPIEAIRAATTNAAQAFGLEAAGGTLSEGRIADIIAVENDPLADIGAMERVVFVMRGGRVIRCAAC